MLAHWPVAGRSLLGRIGLTFLEKCWSAHTIGRTVKSFSLSEYLARVTRQVDAALDRYLPSEETPPATIHKSMRYSVFAGGKRLRPALCLAACEAVGGRVRDAIPLACAVECIHTYSLIHDDLPCMDDDDFRRGKPTNHKVFGEAIAVLAGDALLTLAFELAARDARYVRELAVAAGSRGLIAGQVQDLQNENRAVTLEEVKATHLNKTAALITASVRLGALAGNATAAQLRRLTRYGRDIGLAFQVVDDILDVTSTKEVMGKSVGADAKHHKSTYPKLLGVEGSRQYAQSLITDAHKQLEPFGARATPLRAIADFILNRTH
ncbi:MAG: polyprenyl synthetase family protein [Verrucomicrobiae bacterium]|nr:polyprenyl synthetase family protein [Verrucomicrobiae bacterium]MDW8343059.1 polyprenyl synthetase family protein [Verrucomicrobiae bacterium]